VAPKPSFKIYADLMPECGNGCGELVEQAGEHCYSCESERTYRQDQERRAVVFAGIAPFTLNPLAE
jgi:hypothetical protein